jgi:hypothetical protein
MMSPIAWARLVLLPAKLHSVSSVERVVKSLGTVAVTGEWSIVLALYCSHIIGAHPHALHALTTMHAYMSCRPMMALTLCALETCAHALRICMPSYTGKQARLFFMLEACGPQGAVGHMATSELTPAGRRGLNP